MRTKMVILLVAALLCGCGPKKWDYKIVEIDNSAHADRSDISAQYATLDADTFIKKTDEALADSGKFEFYPTNFTSGMWGLGNDGWELVAVIPQIETTHPVGHDEVISAVRTAKVILIFKRPE